MLAGTVMGTAAARSHTGPAAALVELVEAVCVHCGLSTVACPAGRCRPWRWSTT